MPRKQRIAQFCIRLGLLLLVSGGLLWLPDPHSGDLIQIKNVCVSLLTVIALGILLYDTFFYNRTRW